MISILLLLFDSIGVFNRIKSAGNTFGVKITQSSVDRIEEIVDITKIFGDKKDLLIKIDELESEILKLKSQNTQLSISIDEQKLIDEQSTFTNPTQTIPALVTSYVPDQFGYVVINKGSNNNVKEGDPIVVRNYLLGEVTEVNKSTSIVRLINSPETMLSAISITNNAKGVVRGDFSKGLIMTDIPRGSTIDIGENVITSPENPIFQKGLIVGEVISVVDSDSLATKSAEIKIIPDMRDLSEVFIISIERDNE